MTLPASPRRALLACVALLACQPSRPAAAPLEPLDALAATVSAAGRVITQQTVQAQEDMATTLLPQRAACRATAPAAPDDCYREARATTEALYGPTYARLRRAALAQRAAQAAVLAAVACRAAKDEACEAQQRAAIDQTLSDLAPLLLKGDL